MTSKPHTLLILTMFLIGLYSPSSIGGVYSQTLWGFYGVLFVVLLSRLLIDRDGLSTPWLCVNSILMIASLLAGTILSPFSDYRWGGLVGFLLLAVLYLVTLRDVSAGQILQTFFVIANVLNVFISAAIILGSDTVDRFLIQHYSSFYPDLVEMMTTFRKPILSFATHSAAAFFFYLFFLLNFETYKLRKKTIFMGFSLSYIILGFALLSFSGMALMSFATFQIGHYIAQRRRKAFLIVISIVLVVSGAVLYRYFADIENLATAIDAVNTAVTSPTNGFLGRFSQLGTLFDTINYLRNHPFSPVGVSYRADLFFGDSGPVEYYLRGSIFLVLTVYIGLFAFLRRNLIRRSDAYLLFVVITGFELGFGSLTYIRTLYLLPVFVVYLNDLRRGAGESGEPLMPAFGPRAVLP